MATTPVKRPTLDELVAPLLADGLLLPAPLRWALDQDPQPLAPSTRTAWPEWAHGHGYSVEQVAILKACIGKLTHSGPYLKSLAAEQRSEKTSSFKPPPETTPPAMPSQRREAQQPQPPQPRAEREPRQKRETIHLGGLSIAEIERRKAALSAAGR